MNFIRFHFFLSLSLFCFLLLIRGQLDFEVKRMEINHQAMTPVTSFTVSLGFPSLLRRIERKKKMGILQQKVRERC